MTFDEVFPAFREGKKIKCAKWPDGSYFCVVGKDYVHCIPGTDANEQRAKFIAGLMRTDWEIIDAEAPTVEEPQPVKTLRRRLRD